MQRVIPLPGHEFRGFVVRLYPDRETEEQLKALQDELRYAWNWIVRQVEDSIVASRAYAIREKLVGPRPQRPNYDGLSPDEAKQARRDYRAAYAVWAQTVYKATKSIPGCAPYKLKDWLEHFDCRWDYQLLERVLKWRDPERKPLCGSHILKALMKNYFTKSARRKTFKRKQDHVPLQVRTGTCFEVGDFGTRRGNPFYNCRIKINGLKIRGRLPGMVPKGRVLEGVTVTRQADGWYASVKVELPIRVPPPAVPSSVVGVDVGLKNLAAFVGSDGKTSLVTSERDRDYVNEVADQQARGAAPSRFQQRAARRTRYKIYTEIIKPLGNYETIKVEDLNARIGQMGSAIPSSMRTIYRLLKERYGDRVREVEPAYTSQDCSRCGFRSKESWSYANGPYGACPSCGHTEHRDLNAARNIMAKSPLAKHE